MQHFDYVIIGGGSAGCVLAGRLSEDSTISVCLLEAGGADTSALIHCPAGLALMAKAGGGNWKFETVPQVHLNGRRGYQPRGKVLGGSSSINAMIYARGHRSDYDGWAASFGNDKGAAWNWENVLPVFKKSENNERAALRADPLVGTNFHGFDGPLNVKDLTSPNPYASTFVQAAVAAGYKANDDFNGAHQMGVGTYQVTHKNGERFSAAKAYLTPHLSRPNLTVITNAHVTKIVIEVAGEALKATGVAYTQNGQSHVAHASSEVLLCAGALQSPQILMLSGIGAAEHLREHSIEVKRDLPSVGANLQDHIDVVQVYDTPHLKDFFGLSFGGMARAIKGIFEWRKTRTGMLTTNFAESGGFIKSHPDEPVPDLQLHFVIAKLVDHGRKAQLGHGFSCHVCLLRPKSRGTVRLATNNSADAPLIDPNFLSHPDDLSLLIKGFKAMRTILQAAPLAALGGKELFTANVQTDEEITAYIRATSDTIYHPVGTCKMGDVENDALAVVDAELRVSGIQGLRVVDASVMPTIVGGNTNAPVIMIAEKAALMIKKLYTL